MSCKRGNWIAVLVHAFRSSVLQNGPFCIFFLSQNPWNSIIRFNFEYRINWVISQLYLHIGFSPSQAKILTTGYNAKAFYIRERKLISSCFGEVWWMSFWGKQTRKKTKKSYQLCRINHGVGNFWFWYDCIKRLYLIF